MAYSKNRRLAEIISDTNGNLSVEGLVVPTQSASDNDTSAASTAYVTTAVSGLIDSAPSTLNTLNEIAAALNDDANFNTTVTNAIAAKLPLAGGTLTGNLRINTTLGIGANASSVIGVYVTKSLANGLAAELTNSESSTGSGLVVRGGNNSSTYSADFRDYNSNSLMRIRGDGNVGIGTTSPEAKLDVNADSNQVAFMSRDTGSATYPAFGFAGQVDSNGNRGTGIFLASDGVLAFAAHSAEHMRIMSSGRVGIGPSSPVSLLHISGNSDVSDEACMLTIDDEDTSSGSMIPAIQFRGNGNNLARIRANDQQGLILSGSSGQGDDIVVQAGKVGIGTNGPAVSKGLHINSAGNSELRLTTTQDSGTPTAQIGYGAGSGYFFRLGDAANNEDIMFRTYGNSYIANNLGLGISSPTSPLHVTSTTANTNGMVRFQNNMDNNYETLRIESLGDYDAHIGFFADGSSNYYWGMGVDYSDSGKFKIANDNLLAVNTKLTIDTSGNVGIGTTSPGYTLEVNGTARFGNTQMTSTVPLTFLANNSDNTYMQSTTYAHQNNTSGNFNNGIHIEMGRLTNSNSAEIRAFVIGARGGQSAFKVLGGAQQAGITQDDGDFLGRLWVTGGDAYLSLHTGEAAPVERTRISSYGPSWINSNANGLSTSKNALRVGTADTRKSGSVFVKSGNNDGGIANQTNSFTEYRNLATQWTTTGSDRYWHIKTNIPKSGTGSNIMFVGHVEGYSYGNGGNIVDIKRSGYMYSPSASVINTATVNKGSDTSNTYLNTYISSDNYLAFVCDFGGGYYSGGTFHMQFTSPAGWNCDVAILAQVMNSTSTGHY